MRINLENWPSDSLVHYASNPRRNDHAVEKMAAAIKEFGFRIPIVAKRDGTIVDGHLRKKAADKLGLNEVPVIPADDLTEAQIKAFRLSANKSAEWAEWDNELLALELGGLNDEGFDLGVIGFGEDEIDRLLALNDRSEGLTDEDDTPEAQEWAVTETGDTWLLGKHRVRCGDSTSADDVAALMGGDSADVCFTSPPYLQQRDYTEESADKVQDWDALMRDVFSILPMSEEGQVFVNLGLIHRGGEWIPYWNEWIEFMRSAGWRRFGWYVWDQGPGMPGDWSGRFAPSFEFVFHFNKESVKPQKSRECEHAGEAHGGKGQRGKDGAVKKRSSGSAPVQSMAIHDSVIRVNRQSARHGAGNHPAPYPVELVKIFVESWGGSVYDPFLGSGTTLIAGEKEGRPVYGMELSPNYVDVIVRRWQEFTGKEATLESDGRTFAEVESNKAPETEDGGAS